jgi:predicted phage tail protein
MELSLQIIPAGDTTAREISAATDDVRDALERLPGVSAIAPRQVAAPDHAKGGLVDALGSLALSVAPAALQGVLQLLQSVLAPRPQTKFALQTKDGQVSFEFDPRKISLQEMVDAVQRLRGAAPSL